MLRGTCECPRPEHYCPVHRRRWEYEQDELLAHQALDELGAPRIAGPFPGDAILSVAGRIRGLAQSSGEGCQVVLTIAVDSGVIHAAVPEMPAEAQSPETSSGKM